MLCTQTILLLPDDTGILEHEHECIRCGNVHQFPDEPVEDEMVTMINRIVGAQRAPVAMKVDPPTKHSGLLN